MGKIKENQKKYCDYQLSDYAALRKPLREI